MNERQTLALTHPLNRADQDLSEYREVYQYPSKLLIVSILAVPAGKALDDAGETGPMRERSLP